jgi:hypothetical protein
MDGDAGGRCGMLGAGRSSEICMRFGEEGLW